MKKITWDVDKTFIDCSNNKLHVLQRHLKNLNRAKNNELLPFFNELSLFQLWTDENKTLSSSIKGILKDINDDNWYLNIKIESLDNNKTVNWKIPQIQTVILTVWRVNDILDTLQLNLKCSREIIYMQTGGATLSDLLSINKDIVTNNQLSSAVSFFNQNIR